MINYINAQQVEDVIKAEQTCILNLVAAWCSDCTKQSENFDSFAREFAVQDVPVYQVNVQNDKNVFLSSLEQQLTEKFGGHGFPRTILIKKGKAVDTDNVEIISAAQLTALADKFKELLSLY